MNKKIILIIVLILLLLSLVVLSRQLQSSQDTRSRASSTTSEGMLEAHGALVAGFPQFPVYPGAEIEESSKRVQPLNTSRDIRAEWISKDSVPKIMDWYIPELKKAGWTVEEPDDRTATEQVAHLSRGNFEGYIGVEDEGTEGVEIVVDFRITQP